MRYALSLDDNGRILSVSFYNEHTPKDVPVVEEIPDGNVYEYIFVNGQFIHDPLPEPEPPVAEPTADEILNARLGVNRYA